MSISVAFKIRTKSGHWSKKLRWVWVGTYDPSEASEEARKLMSHRYPLGFREYGQSKGAKGRAPVIGQLERI